MTAHPRFKRKRPGNRVAPRNTALSQLQEYKSESFSLSSKTRVLRAALTMKTPCQSHVLARCTAASPVRNKCFLYKYCHTTATHDLPGCHAQIRPTTALDATFLQVTSCLWRNPAPSFPGRIESNDGFATRRRAWNRAKRVAVNDFKTDRYAAIGAPTCLQMLDYTLPGSAPDQPAPA